MKTPRPRLPMPKVPVKVPGMRAVTGVFAGTFAGTFAEPRWDKARDTLHTQITAAMKSGRSYGKTIAPHAAGDGETPAAGISRGR